MVEVLELLELELLELELLELELLELELLELDSSPLEDTPVVVSVSPVVGPVAVSVASAPPEESSTLVVPPLELPAAVAELCPVPDWLPPELVMVSMSIGVPVELLPEPASVSESNATEGVPQAEAVIRANPSKKPLRIRTAYRFFATPERLAPKKKDGSR